MDIKNIVNKSSFSYRVGMIIKQLRDSLQPAKIAKEKINWTKEDIIK